SVAGFSWLGAWVLRGWRVGLRCRLRLLAKLGEPRGIVHRQVSEDLAVEFHPALSQPADELAVAHAVLAASRGNANDPQRTELALLLPPARIGKLQPALNRLLGCAVKLGFGQEIAAGAVKNLFALGTTFCATFNPRHRSSPFFSCVAAAALGCPAALQRRFFPRLEARSCFRLFTRVHFSLSGKQLRRFPLAADELMH